MAKKGKVEKETRGRIEKPSIKTKDARKRELRTKLEKVSTHVEQRRKELETKEQRLAELSKSEIRNPEDQAEYEKLFAEEPLLRTKLMEWETGLQKLQQEDTEMATSSADDLFASDSESEETRPVDLTKPQGKAQIGLTEPNGKTTPLVILDSDDDDDEEATFTLAQGRDATGQSHGGKIVAWREQDRSKPVIVMYGPKNLAKYERSTAAKEDDDFDENDTKQFGPDHRLGDVKDKKKFIRRRGELIGISGLAYNCDLEDLRPKEKGETRRLPPLEVLVKWNISGVIEKTWEIRSSLRHLFSNAKKCDVYIYESAKYHDTRHQQWLGGQRRGKDVSPTPAPNSRLSPSPAPNSRLSPTSAPNSRLSPSLYPQLPVKEEIGIGEDILPSVEAPKESKMLQYQRQWCELKGIDPKNMTSDTMSEFLIVWNKIKGTA